MTDKCENIRVLDPSKCVDGNKYARIFAHAAYTHIGKLKVDK